MKRLDLWNLEQKLRKKQRAAVAHAKRIANDDDGDGLERTEGYHEHLGASYGYQDAAETVRKLRLTAAARTEIYRRRRARSRKAS